MNISARLTVTRPSYSRSKEAISVEITDAVSGCRLLELEVGVADFMKALTGLAGVEATGIYYEKCPVGKVAEHKTLLFPRPSSVDVRQRTAYCRNVLEPFELDGWRGRDDDLFNHHNWVRKDGEELVEVTFGRFVDPPEKA